MSVALTFGAPICGSAFAFAGCGTPLSADTPDGSSVTSGGSSGGTSGTSSGGSSGGSSGNGGGSSGGSSSGSSSGSPAGDGGPGGGDGGGGDGGSCTPNKNGFGDNDAGWGCNGMNTDTANLPGECDNGIRLMPPTCNATIDKLLALTPLADKTHPCATPTNGKAYNLDESPTDPDTLAGHTAEMCKLNGAIYWVADQDIDCDGKMSATCPGPAGPDQDCCWQDQDTYGVGADGSLDPNAGATNPFSSQDDEYIVVPSDNVGTIPPGTVVAVIYGSTMTFAVFADTGPTTVIGEGSVATAKALGYSGSPGRGGIMGNVVTYIAFTGAGTVPAKVEDRPTIDALGGQLVQQLLMNNP
jgi:hypothetical protein